MKKLSIILVTSMMLITPLIAESKPMKKLRVATFNVSMEALNYLADRHSKPSGKELADALNKDHTQINNIAEIIQKTNPDIILLNEFDRISEDGTELKLFLNDYLAKSQNGQPSLSFPYFYQAPVNTGVVAPVDFNQNGVVGESPNDTYGFGHFPGHFAMAVLSKYPLDIDNIRTFQHFKWKDMPNALKPTLPDTGNSYYADDAWHIFRLSSKSFWDIPVLIENETLHILASHPTPPVFDGPEDRNGKRNHDEIRLLTDYISDDNASYLYDDKGMKGGLGENKRFVIVGDLNASNVDGDAINEGINRLLTHPKVVDPKPQSEGGKAHASQNSHGKHHTAYWGMRADYVLPSQFGINIIDSGVFWPTAESADYRLIKDRAASSDHRLVWLDIELK